MTKKLLIAALLYVISVANTDDTRCKNNAPEKISDCTRAAIITTLLNNAQNILEDAKTYAVLKTSQDSATTLRRRLCDLPADSDEPVDNHCSTPMDCADILDSNPAAQSGTYRIWPRNRAIEGFVEVYCDMDDEGGAWTVIQRRGDFGSAQDYFYKNWDAYKRGFGDLNKDFWLGNDKIHAVTSQRFNTVKFVLSDFKGNTTYATYDDFWIEDEIRNYTLHVSGYNGTAGNSFSYHDGSQFSTKDRDNDDSSYHCAAKFSGAWWFKDCSLPHLNGLYLNVTHKVNYYEGVQWNHFRGHYYSLKDTLIKIRPRDYRRKVLDVPTPH